MGNIIKTLLGLCLFHITVFTAKAQQTVSFSAGKPTDNQEVCGSALLHDRLLLQDDQYRARIARNENLLQAARLQYDPASRINKTNAVIWKIPVVVHIIHLGEAIGTGNNISDAQVNSAISALNDMYRKKSGTYGDGGGVDMEVEFQLATRDPDCNPTTGIVRVNGSGVTGYSSGGVYATSAGADEVDIKDLSRWPNTDYYNIWVVSEIDNNNGGAGIQGYAYFPGAPAYLDGTIVINSAFGTTGTVKSYTNRGQTLAHEMGHAFNLYHTFEGDNNGTACPPSTNGCGPGLGDCIADTEPHIRSNSTCPAGTYNTCTSATIGNVYKNYMDYSSQTCSNEFTTDQKARVRDAITLLRPGLLNSQALNPGTASQPVAASCSPSGTVVSNSFALGIYKVTLDTSSVVSDGTVDENTFLMDRSCNQQFSLGASSDFAISITTGPANNENVKVYLDYNNNGLFTDPGELIFTSNNAVNHAGTITPAATKINNTALRLRVISDFTSYTITGPCYLPQYGQIEDYSVTFISPLPVQFKDFTARKHSDKTLLQWTTAQERNNSYFEIERSTNSKNWQPIGKVPGAGNVASERDYSYQDFQPAMGNNYYRLKQVDFDGKFTFSPIRMLTFLPEPAALQVFPNPGTGNYTLKIENSEPLPVQLRVFDAKGCLILQQQTGPQKTLGFSIEKHPAGLYMLEASYGNLVKHLKIIKE